MSRRAVVLVLAACSSAPAKPDAPTSAWSKGPPLPLPRIEAGVAAMGQMLIVVGGFDTGQSAGLDVTKQVDWLDTSMCPGTASQCAWNMAGQLPDAPVARHHAQVAAIGTTLYLLGGLDGTPDAQNNYPARGDTYRLDTLDLATGWEPLASMPAGLERGSAAVVVVPPRIDPFGGANATSALATNIYYDTSSDRWCPNPADPMHDACPTGPTVPDLPAPRSHPAAMRRVDGTFVVVGGLSGLTSDTDVADAHQLVAGATAWDVDGQNHPVAFTAMPQARGGCAYGVIQGQLVCAGGEAGTSALKVVESYDALVDPPPTGQPSPWTEDEMMPESTAGTQGAAIGVRLFVPGGSRTVPSLTLSFEPTDTLYIFAPLDTATR